MSFVGFFVNYMYVLRPRASAARPEAGESDRTLSPIPSSIPSPPNQSSAAESMILICGGYSYGSMITSYLPSTTVILARFANPVEGSAEAEIRLRARRLASRWNDEEAPKPPTPNARGHHGRQMLLGSTRSASHTLIGGGGEEAAPGRRGGRRETRPRLDSIRKSFDFSRESRSQRRGGWERRESHDGVMPVVDIPVPVTFYLLVSPLLPPVSALATLFTDLGQVARESRDHHDIVRAKLTSNPSLAIYGTRDTFTSHKRLVKWSRALAQRPASKFQYREVTGGGHFWHEEGVDDQLRAMVGRLAEDALAS